MRRRSTFALTPVLLVSIAAGHSATPAVQQGLASFYGKGFHGKRTSTGERFDQNQLTAAHPSYPGGTILKVTNLENQRSVRVRVIDRGPARWVRREGVIVDLSRAAARRLKMTEDGRVLVRVEVVRTSSGG
jgi:rare lipoprotein A